MVDKKILPVFGKIPINEITPKDIRKWQNGLTAYRDKNGKPYAQTYLRAINNQLTAMFNYAVKYYDLRENPCTKAGSMGKSNAEEMQFCIFRKNRALAPHERSAVPLGTDHCPVC